MKDADSFLDTNILIYAFGRQDSAKRQIARRLIAPNAAWHISWQVVQEFCHVALHNRSRPVPAELTATLVEELLAPHCRVQPSRAIWLNALEIQNHTRYRFYDSLIIASAIESGASVLYSEDMQHDRRIGPVHVINPFR